MIIYFGTFLEFFEFMLFVTLFPVLSSSFSSHLSIDQQATLQYFLFWIGFIARPLGAIVLAPIGDIYNRRSLLILSIVGMAFTTMLMGCVPIFVDLYITISMIIVLRFFQGFFTGVEYTAATLYAYEHQHKETLKKHTSVIYMGMMASLGACAAYFIAALCQLELMVFLNFWRSVFFLTGFFTLWVGILRLIRLPKDYINKPTVIQKKMDTKERFNLFKIHLCTFILISMSYVPYYYIITFLNVNAMILQKDQPFYAMLFNSFICLLYVLIILGIIKIKKTFSFSFSDNKIILYHILFAIFLWPMSHIIFTNSSALLRIIPQVILIILSQLIVCNLIPHIPKFFKQYHRSRSYALVQTLAASILGGSAPLICYTLSTITSFQSLAVIYPILLTFLSLLSYLVLRKII